jgi:hypothetical protein
MRQKIILPLLIILLGMISCDQSKFKYFYSNIDTINCPILIDCKGLQSLKSDYAYVSKHPRRKDLIKSRFAPKNMEGIVGQIFPSSSSKYFIFAAIGDNVYFFLFSYDSKGQRIDSVRLSGYCNNDELIEPHFSTKISDNKLITWIDTVKVYSIDTLLNKRIYVSTRIDSGKIRIDESGKFIRLFGNRTF